MGFLSDKAIERLRCTPDLPDFSGTRYTLLEVVARGGMGVVYLALDRTLNRRVALKVLDAADPNAELAERLTREAQILAQLEHPGVVPVHDVGTLPGDQVFYVMKFVEGLPLDRFLASMSFLPERLRTFLRVCEPVSFAHSRGVLHRDLKPANLMAGAFGEVLVLDWGLAKILLGGSARPNRENASLQEPSPHPGLYGAGQPATATEHGLVMGTPGFMSPEQEQGESASLDVRSDVFSLGKLLEFLVTDWASLANGKIPKALRAVIVLATSTRPADRYPSVADLAAEVSRFLDGLPVSAYRENLWERLQRFYQRYRAAIVLIIMYLVMRTLFVLYARHGS